MITLGIFGAASRHPVRRSLGASYPYILPVSNAGFETGEATPWTNLIGGLPVILTDPVASGTYAGSSPANGSALTMQTIEMPSELYSDIDAGYLEATMEAMLAGWSGAGGNDAGGLVMDFLDESDTRIAISFDEGQRYNTTTYASRSLTAYVPEGTRSIRIGWRGFRMVTGSNCDVYVDDFLDLVINKRDQTHETVFATLANSTTGWTTTAGTQIVGSPQYGLGLLAWNGTTGASYMTAALPSGRNSAIDAGTANLILDAIFSSFIDDNADVSRSYIEFYDGSDTIIGSRVYNEAAELKWGSWGVGKRYVMNIPASARSIRFGLVGTRAAGTELSAYLLRARALISNRSTVNAHRYWRVFAVDNNGSADFTTINRIEMYSSVLDGTARIDRCIGGTPIYSSQGGLEGTEPATGAFDDNNAAIWATAPAGAARLNCWLGYDFGSPIAIDRFSLQARGAFTNQTPQNFRLEYSDDGVAWTTLFTPAAQTAWGKNEQRLFAAPTYSQGYKASPHGSHRYWRIHCATSNSDNNTFAVAEVEMRATPGGADQCTGGTATAHSDFSGSFNAPKAFDNDSGTLWSADGGSSNGWLKYDFGTPVSVTQVMIQARNDDSFGQTPRWGQIEFSDDDSIWHTAWSYAMPLTYSAGLSQVTTDPAYG